MATDQIRLLLIEDVPQVAKYVRSLLAAQAQIRLLDIIDDGSRAIALVEEQRPDVIIVDALLQGRVRGMTVVRLLHERRLGIPIMVLTVPQHPVRADPSQGIDDVIAMPFNAYDLVTRVKAVHQAVVARSERGPCRMIAVFAPKGGVGKSTIAFNLASAATILGARTVLIDGSMQFGDLRSLLQVPEEAPSLLDLPTDHVTEEDLRDVLWRESSGLDVLLAPPRVEMAEMVSPRDIDKVLAVLRRAYDLVIVDVGVTLDELNLAFLDEADDILQIVVQEHATLRNTTAVLETFAKIGYPPEKVRFLVNRADKGGPEDRELATAIGREPDFRVGSDGPLVVGANNRGIPFVLSDPNAAVSKEVIKITRELIARRERTAVAAR
ncbi:MAG: CpaE family protein [Chloroflexota bacterium]